MFPANARALMVRPRGRGVLLGDEAFQLNVVGTVQHQMVLEKIGGGRSRVRCAALLILQPENSYERDEVAVTIHDREVGFLPFMDRGEFVRALRLTGYADAACEAEIMGGWKRRDGDWEYVGVRLNACLPFTIVSADDWYERRARLE